MDNEISLFETVQIASYRRALERWQRLPPVKYVAPMGVRLLAMRVQIAANVDYDDFVRLVSCNIPHAMQRVRAELQVRREFLTSMIDRHADSAEEPEELKKALTEEIVAVDSYEGQARLYAFLQRMVSRYWRLERHTERRLH